MQERTFDLDSAVVKNGKLSWLIKALKLKDNEEGVMIKDIQVTFHKKPWL